MARQIINNRPLDTNRQRAFEKGLDNIVGSVQKFAAGKQRENEQKAAREEREGIREEAKTERQRAFDQRNKQIEQQGLNQDLALFDKTGGEVSLEDIRKRRAGEEPGQLLAGQAGPALPGDQTVSGRIGAALKNRAEKEAKLTKSTQEAKNRLVEANAKKAESEAKIAGLPKEQQPKEKRAIAKENRAIAKENREIAKDQRVIDKGIRERTLNDGTLIRTKEEATKIRSAQTAAAESSSIIDEMVKLGTNISPLDPRDFGRIKKLDQLKKLLVGKMRVAVIGPGTMTEDEFKRMVDTMGNPASLVSTEKIEIAKLNQMRDLMTNGVKNSIISAAENQPQQEGQPQQAIAQQPQQSQGIGMATANANDIAGMDRSQLIQFIGGQ